MRISSTPAVYFVTIIIEVILQSFPESVSQLQLGKFTSAERGGSCPTNPEAARRPQIWSSLKKNSFVCKRDMTTHAKATCKLRRLFHSV